MEREDLPPPPRGMSSSDSHNEAQGPRRYRRTRFVCISDTHNQTLRLPKGDVLIHAGDLTNQGSFSEACAGLKPLLANQAVLTWVARSFQRR